MLPPHVWTGFLGGDPELWLETHLIGKPVAEVHRQGVKLVFVGLDLAPGVGAPLALLGVCVHLEVDSAAQ